MDQNLQYKQTRDAISELIATESEISSDRSPDPISEALATRLPEKDWYNSYDFLDPVLDNGRCQILFERSFQDLYSEELFERTKGTLLEWEVDYKHKNFMFRRKSQVITKAIDFGWLDMKKYLAVDDVNFIMNMPPHDNLAQIYEVFVSGKTTLVITSERLTYSLGKFLKYHKEADIRVPFDIIRTILFDILNGLQHIHKNGIYLGGLCINSILISDNNEYYTDAYLKEKNINIKGVKVKLADFGTAKRISSDNIKIKNTLRL